MIGVMQTPIIPIFTSHHSIGQSILTLESDIYKKINEKQADGTYLPKKTKEVEITEPTSIFAIAKKHEEESVFLVESDISSYWKFYKNAKELGVRPIYGIKLAVCSDMEDKEPTSKKTESNIIVVFKNSQAYYDMVPFYSAASTIGMNGHRRIDWKNLHKYWTDNFLLLVPFYSSFIARNLMVHNQSSLPEFRGIEPTFLIQQQGLPFDEMILSATQNYCRATSTTMQDAHQVYYYKNEDVMTHQTIQCIRKRSSWQKPNLEHYASDQFSYEAYLEKIGKTI
jgi:DNA polymerase III alpha subunit